MPTPNQIHRTQEDVRVTSRDLLQVPKGPVTEAGVRLNVNVALRYLESWLRGTGCVPINHLMEDAATVEISRTQLWQWIHHQALTEDSCVVTADRVRRILEEERDVILSNPGEAEAREESLRRAGAILEGIVTSAEFVEFLTLVAYQALDPGRETDVRGSA
jgi:malate synthase